MNIPTKTVRFTKPRYTGWRRWLRRLALRPDEYVTYEQSVYTTGTYYDAENDSEVTVFGAHAAGPPREVK